MRNAIRPLILIILWLGVITLITGCGSSDDGVTPNNTESGTVQITVVPSDFPAPWNLDGPNDFDRSGTGSGTISDAPVGAYEITWDAVSDWTLISSGATEQTLADNGTLQFSAIYLNVTLGPAVTAPTATSLWRQGQSDVPIRWTGGDASSLVSIALYHASDLVVTIADQIANTGEFLTWDVPGDIVPTDGYRVRVTVGSAVAWSQNFSISAALEILTPDASSLWVYGTDVEITWESAQSGGTLQLDLYRADSFVQNIAAAAPNTGTAIWTVPGALTIADDYTVRAALGSVSAESMPFTISDSAAPLEVILPDATTSWYPGQQGVAITWTGGDPGQTVDLFLYRGTLQVAVVGTGLINDGSLDTWNVPDTLALASDYRVQITQGTSVDYGDYFTLVAAPLVIIAPEAHTLWVKGETVSIRWTGANPGQNVWIRLYRGMSSVGYITASTPNTGVYEWTIPDGLVPSDQYQVSMGQNSIWVNGENFTIIGPPLEVSEPTADTIWSPGQSNVPISWTGGDPSPQTISLAIYQGTTQIAEIASYIPNEGSHDTWDVPLNIPFGTDYRVRVAQGANISYSPEFQIGSVSLEVTSPDAASQWYPNRFHGVTWTGGNPTQNVALYLYEGPAQIQTISAGTTNDGFYNWWLPASLTPGTNYRVQVAQAADFDHSDYFEILPAAQSLAIQQPNAATVWLQNQQNVTIQWTGGELNVPVDLYLFTSPYDSMSIAVNTPNDGSFTTWDVPGSLPDNYYQVRVNQGWSQGWSSQFLIGTNPPSAVPPPASTRYESRESRR